MGGSHPGSERQGRLAHPAASAAIIHRPGLAKDTDVTDASQQSAPRPRGHRRVGAGQHHGRPQRGAADETGSPGAAHEGRGDRALRGGLPRGRGGDDPCPCPRRARTARPRRRSLSRSHRRDPAGGRGRAGDPGDDGGGRALHAGRADGAGAGPASRGGFDGGPGTDPGCRRRAGSRKLSRLDERGADSAPVHPLLGR